MSPQYDVFISYNSKDREIVTEVANHLNNHDITTWLDSHAIPLGERWVPALEEGISNSKIIAVFIGDNELGPWQQYETELALNNKYRVLPVLLPGADTKKIPSFLKLFNWLDLRDRTLWKAGFRRLAQTLQTKMKVYENKMMLTGDVQIDFYNRDQEQSRIDLPRLENTYHHFISIEAPSGYGKSHLLKYIVQRTNTEPELAKKWISFYIDVSKIEGNQIAYILEFISGESQYQDNDDARKFLCNYIQTELPKHEDAGGPSRGVLLVFDAVEKLSPNTRSWLCILLHDIILQSYMDYDLNNVAFPVRVLIGGRNTTAFWEEMVQVRQV